MSEIDLDVEAGELPPLDGGETEIEVETSADDASEVTVIVENEGEQEWETEHDQAAPEVAQAVAEATIDVIQQSEIERLQMMVQDQGERINQLQSQLDSGLTSIWSKLTPAPEAESEAEVFQNPSRTRSKRSLLMRILT